MSRPPYRVLTHRPSTRYRRPLALVLALVTVLLTGCATFPDTHPREWREKPENGGPLVAPPRVPDETPESEPNQPPAQPGQPAVPTGCVDPDPQVVATCLNPVSAIAVLPDPETALVAERDTGRVLRVRKDEDPEVIATVPVDASAGGLMGLVLSPSYLEDQLLYAYAATPSDSRVLRIAPGDPPRPILTGIPRGDGSGALGVGKDGALLVATGGSGELGGKLLRIDTFGKPFKDNPNPASPIYSSGLRSPGGVCTAPDTGTVWVTDRLPDRDVLHQATPGQLGEPAWSWPDRPGVAGCVAPPGAVVVAEQNTSALFLLHSTAPGAFTGTPRRVLNDTYGRLGPTALAPDGLIWLGTQNKTNGGKAVSSDDRAIRIQPPAGGGGSGPE